MELTEYTIYKYDSKEYIRFESVERNFLGMKKTVMRFIPRKMAFDMKGRRIKKWKYNMFSTEVNKVNKHLLICGNKNEKSDFIERFPNIQQYLNELNTFTTFY
jgi:hypothetical protein